MGWDSWIRDGREIEPSLYAADFTRLGEQIDVLLAAGCRVFHFDVGDGHFVPPVTIGPVVLRSIAPMIHAAGGVVDCHLMVSDPAHHFPEFAESGADSVTFHVEATDDPVERWPQRRAPTGLRSASPSSPATTPARAATAAESAGADMILCMSIEPGYSGQAFMPEAFARIEELATLVDIPIQVDGGVGEANAEGSPRGGCEPARCRERGLRRPGSRCRVRADPRRRSMSLERALALVDAAGPVGYPNPTVGAVLVADGAIVGEGVTEPYGGRHGEVVALAAAGDLARGATLFVTMEPCAHHGRTPPCVDAILAAGVARVVAGCLDPNPEAAGGLERLRAAGVEVELDDRFEARRQNEAWRTWKSLGRPFVVYKAAISLDGRVTVPGRRWVTGEASRRQVHELRASLDAVAVGMGTVRADAPRLDARDVPSCGSRAGSPSAGGRCRRNRRSSCGRGDSTRSSPRSQPRACSRCCSRAGRRSRRRSSRPGSSTSCSSSWRRCSPETGRTSSAISRRRGSCSTPRRGRSARTCSSRRTSASRSAAPTR